MINTGKWYIFIFEFVTPGTRPDALQQISTQNACLQRACPWKYDSSKFLITVLFDYCSVQITLFLSLAFRSHLESHSFWIGNFSIFYQLNNAVRNKTKKSSEKHWGQLSWATVSVQLIQVVIKKHLRLIPK